MFKCKYCGNQLHPAEGQTMVTCERCDEVTRIITVNNEKKYRLLEEAAELRLHCLFDRAKQRYEAVLQEYPEEGDAYWGYVLCEYGIEFQKDSRTDKYLPTLHRISQKSILQDLYYKKALEYANPVDVSDYRRIASELERIRKRFLELSQKEENHYDVFISFKQTDENTRRETIDSSRAENIYHKLKDKGYRVFFSKITLANRGGDDYEPIIYMALETSKVMLALGSQKEYLEAPWVRNEWSRFLDMMQEKPEKKILPVLINEMDPVQLPDALQGIQGYNIDTPVGMDRLLSRVRELFPEKKKVSEKSAEKAFGATEESLLKRAKLELDAAHWDEANGYYNRILEANPESARAWLGWWMASDGVRARSLEEIEKRVDGWIQNPKTETFCVDLAVNKIKKYDGEKDISLEELFRKGDQRELSDVIIQKIRGFEVANYLSREKIYEFIPLEFCFESASEWYGMIMENVQRIFEAEYFQHTLEYSKEEEKKKLSGFREKLIQKIEDAQVDSIQEYAEKSESLKAEYQKKYEKAEKKIRELSENAKKLREEDYQKALAVNSSNEIQIARNLFEKVGNYKDAEERCYALDGLNNVKAIIGNGRRYLAERILRMDEQAVLDYARALFAQELGGKASWKNYLCLALYAIYVGMVLLAGNVITIFCIAGGVAAGWYLWKNEKVIPGYIAFAALHIVSGMTIGVTVAGVLGAVYVFSAFWKNGYANYLFGKKRAKIVCEQTKQKIENYEWELREELDEIWQKALGIRYDGVTLTPALDGYRFDYLDGTVELK